MFQLYRNYSYQANKWGREQILERYSERNGFKPDYWYVSGYLTLGVNIGIGIHVSGVSYI
jgi:hypothetical protein